MSGAYASPRPQAGGKPSASWTLDSGFSRLAGRLSSRGIGLYLALYAIAGDPTEDAVIAPWWSLALIPSGTVQ